MDTNKSLGRAMHCSRQVQRAVVMSLKMGLGCRCHGGIERKGFAGRSGGK
jgi:hypothetical protein